jgi:hypothetical protein
MRRNPNPARDRNIAEFGEAIGSLAWAVLPEDAKAEQTEASGCNRNGNRTPSRVSAAVP